MKGVVQAVLDGKADVGFLRLCYFEDMIDPKETDPNQLRIIGDRKKELNCSHSTDLYPSWTISTTRHISPEKAKEVLQVLLAISPTEKGAFWGLASNYHGVDSLFKDLKLGPWYYLREWTVNRFLSTYWPAVFGLVSSLHFRIDRARIQNRNISKTQNRRTRACPQIPNPAVAKSKERFRAIGFPSKDGRNRSNVEHHFA